jgi:hypothetical protein
VGTGESILSLSERIILIKNSVVDVVNEDKSSPLLIWRNATYISFSSQTYTLQYEVSAVRSGEEFTLYYEYENPEGDSIGGGLLFSTVPDCIDVTLCQHTFEVDFEYNEPFEASFTITCAGCENNPPNVCIETFVDFYSIGVACGMSGNPNDGYNFALITDNVIVNNQVMKNV